MSTKTIIKSIAINLFALLTSVSIFSQNALEQTAIEKISSLNNLIATAQDKGIDVTKEKMSIRTAELFLKWANWDENNITKNTAIYEHRLPLPKARRSEYTPNTLATFLPNFERTEVNKLLDDAISTLQRIINGDEIRTPTNIIDWHNLNINGNKVEQNGTPVFLHDWTWKSNTDPNLIEFYGELGGSFFVPGNLEKKANGTINIRSSTRSKLERDARISAFGAPFLGQTSVPNYLKNEFPDITNAQTTFTKFDIDHPQTKKMHADLFREVVPIFKDKKVSQLGYMISNEPHWNSAGNWDVIDPSDYTRNKFIEWLKTKHNNNINNLKSVWSTNPSSFQAAAYSLTFPIPYSRQGTGEWYDWMRFNQERVTEYFLFLKDEIVKNDPNAKVHIKLIPKHWSGNLRHYGLDFEELTKLSHINGNDVGAHKSYMWGNREKWEDHYSFEWREIALSYDFFDSVQPDAINYNSESHMISTVRFRDIFLNPEYIRASHWLATLHGLDATKNWLWGRDEDGSVPQRAEEGHSGSNLQQPRIFNEIISTMLDVNTFPNEIDALQNTRKAVRIFYSETSAINSISGPSTGTVRGSTADYMDRIFELYESIYFNGLPLGFATKNIIQTQNNSNWDLIVVKETEFVKTEEINALQSYLDKGHTIIIDSKSLKKDEYGRPHSTTLNQSNGKLIISNPADFSKNIKQVLTSKNIQPVIELTEVNPLGTNIKGCFNKSITLNGRKVINIVNLSNKSSTVSLSVNNSDKNYKYINLLNGKILPANFSVLPEQVLLLEAFAEAEKETLEIIEAPTCIKPEGKTNFKLKYNTNTERDIHVDLQNKKTLAIEDAETSTVNGSGEIIINFDSNKNLKESDTYQFNIYLSEKDKDFNFKIENNSFQKNVTINLLCNEGLSNLEPETVDTKIRISPNPVKNKFTIENLPKDTSWDIIDVNSKKIATGTNNEVDASNLSSGIYLIRLSNGTSLKFIK